MLIHGPTAALTAKAPREATQCPWMKAQLALLSSREFIFQSYVPNEQKYVLEFC